MGLNNMHNKKVLRENESEAYRWRRILPVACPPGGEGGGGFPVLVLAAGEGEGEREDTPVLRPDWGTPSPSQDQDRVTPASLEKDLGPETSGTPPPGKDLGPEAKDQWAGYPPPPVKWQSENITSYAGGNNLTCRYPWKATLLSFLQCS